MKKLWLITSGEYSDYSVLSIWDDEELAKKEHARIKIINTYVNDLEEQFNLNESSEPGPLTVRMYKDGECDFYGSNVDDLVTIIRPESKYSYRDRPIPLVLIFKSGTTDPVSAIKAANELRAQLIALDRWKEGPV